MKTTCENCPALINRTDINENDLRKILAYLVRPDGKGLFLEYNKMITAEEKKLIMKVYKRLNP